LSDRSLVVVHSTLAVGARIAQERLGVTTVTVNLSPGVFRSVFRTPVVNGLWLPSWLPRGLKRAVFHVGDLLVADRWLAKPINQFRFELGLGPVRHILDGWFHSLTLTLGAWPSWFGPVASDRPPCVRLTGFPLFDGLETTPMPQDVGLFLERTQSICSV